MCLAAATLVLPAAATTADPPTIVGWHKIGAFDLGMQKTAVVYRYGYGRSDPYHSVSYALHGGVVGVDYGNAKVGYSNRVIQLDENSPYYRAPGDIGVGSVVPLPPCQTVAGACVRHWNGFVLGEDPTTGATAWKKYVHYSGHKIIVEALVYKGRIVNLIVGLCGPAWACPKL